MEVYAVWLGSGEVVAWRLDAAAHKDGWGSGIAAAMAGGRCKSSNIIAPRSPPPTRSGQSTA